MGSLKVIITKQRTNSLPCSFENEIGLSTYDLALISIKKIIKRSKSAINEPSQSTYLI